MHFLLQNCFDMRHFKHVISILVSEPCMCLSSLGQIKIRHSPVDAIIVILKRSLYSHLLLKLATNRKTYHCKLLNGIIYSLDCSLVKVEWSKICRFSASTQHSSDTCKSLLDIPLNGNNDLFVLKSLQLVPNYSRRILSKLI